MLAELAARRASGESGQPAKGAAQGAAGAGAADLKEPSESEEEDDAGMFSEAELEQLRQEAKEETRMQHMCARPRAPTPRRPRPTPRRLSAAVQRSAPHMKQV
jgi:hypothetical protein